MDVKNMTNEELIQNFYDSYKIYDHDVCEELCKRAGMEDDWKLSDGDTFERVVITACFTLETE